MNTIKHDDEEFVFDDVSFAIDVRAARAACSLSRRELAKETTFLSGNSFSSIEGARAGLTMKSYLSICNTLNLSPDQYFVIQGK